MMKRQNRRKRRSSQLLVGADWDPTAHGNVDNPTDVLLDTSDDEAVGFWDDGRMLDELVGEEEEEDSISDENFRVGGFRHIKAPGILGPKRPLCNSNKPLFMSHEPWDTSEAALLREQSYNYCFNTLSSRINTLFHNVYLQLFHQMKDFIKSSSLTKSQIPFGFIQTGFSGDSRDVFLALLKFLSTDYKVKIMRSSECPTLKLTLNNWIRSIMGKSYVASSGFEQLIGQVNGPVIAIFEDFEKFDTKILQDCISLCCHYRSKIPFVIFFCYSTTADSLQRKLPFTTIAFFDRKDFQFPNPEENFDKIVTEVLLCPDVPLRFGTKAIEFLEYSYKNFGFSIVAFWNILKFITVHHFLNHPLSILCCLDPLKVLPKISEDFLREGVMHLMFETNNNDVSECMEGDIYHFVSERIKGWKDYRSNFVIAFECYCYFLVSLKGRTQSKTSLLIALLDIQNFQQCVNHLIEEMKIILQKDYNTVLKLLETWRDKYAITHSKDIQEIIKQVEEHFVIKASKKRRSYEADIIDKLQNLLSTFFRQYLKPQTGPFTTIIWTGLPMKHFQAPSTPNSTKSTPSATPVKASKPPTPTKPFIKSPTADLKEILFQHFNPDLYNSFLNALSNPPQQEWTEMINEEKKNKMATSRDQNVNNSLFKEDVWLLDQPKLYQLFKQFSPVTIQGLFEEFKIPGDGDAMVHQKEERIRLARFRQALGELIYQGIFHPDRNTTLKHFLDD